MPVLPKDLFLWGQVLLLHRGNHDVVRIDHLCEMDFADFGKQLVSIEFGEAIVGVYPGYQLGEGDPHGVVDGTIDARGHDFLFVFETWPGGPRDRSGKTRFFPAALLFRASACNAWR